MKSIFFLSLLFLWVVDCDACNGNEKFCSKKFNEITYLKTHNSTSTTEKRLFGILPNPVANQHKGVPAQLQDGVRGFKVPLHMNNSNVWLAHTLSKREFNDRIAKITSSTWIISLLNRYIGNNLWKMDATNQSSEVFLGHIKNFLDKNPKEVVTLFLNVFVGQDHLTDVVNTFKKTGLYDQIYDKDQEAWPTLQEMINKNKRLVVFADEELDPRTRKFLGTREVISNAGTFKTVEDLKADVSLQQMQKHDSNWYKDLGIVTEMGHNIAGRIAGDAQAARLANTYAVVKTHATKFKDAAGVSPNFVSVDFYDENLADIKKVLHEINAEQS